MEVPPEVAAMTRAMWTTRTRVVDIPGLTNGSIPLMRLLIHHSPALRVEVMDGTCLALAPIGELDWSHESLAELNAPPRPVLKENTDRAQLAALGRATTGNA